MPLLQQDACTTKIRVRNILPSFVHPEIKDPTQNHGKPLPHPNPKLWTLKCLTGSALFHIQRGVSALDFQRCEAASRQQDHSSVGAFGVLGELHL